MRAKTWLGCLGFLAACGGFGDPEPGNYAGPASEYPWDAQNENGETRVKAAIRAVGYGGVTTVSVSLWDANAYQQRTELAENDRLTARIGDEELPLELHTELFSGAAIYVATFADDAPGTGVEVTLDSQQWGDARAELTLPDRVTMTAPSGDSAPDLKHAIDVTWEGGAASDVIGANYQMTCDDGRLTGWRAGSEDEGLMELAILAQDEPCTLSIAVERQKFGTMEGSWGGSAVGGQSDGEEWLLP